METSAQFSLILLQGPFNKCLSYGKYGKRLNKESFSSLKREFAANLLRLVLLIVL